MAGKEVTLDKAQECKDCGAILPVGEKAKEYATRQGGPIYYCSGPHTNASPSASFGRSQGQGEERRQGNPSTPGLAGPRSPASVSNNILKSVALKEAVHYWEGRNSTPKDVDSTFAHFLALLEGKA